MRIKVRFFIRLWVRVDNFVQSTVIFRILSRLPEIIPERQNILKTVQTSGSFKRNEE